MAFDTYMNYTGTYQIFPKDIQSGIIEHHVDMAFNPSMIGRIQRRDYPYFPMLPSNFPMFGRKKTTTISSTLLNFYGKNSHWSSFEEDFDGNIILLRKSTNIWILLFCCIYFRITYDIISSYRKISEFLC